MKGLETTVAGLTRITATLLSASGLFGASSLEQLAAEKFGHLTPAESRLLRSAPTGDTAWCGPSANTADPSNDPSHAATWGQTRTVRSALVRWLYTDPRAIPLIAVSGVSVGGALLDGRLDLSRIKTDLPLQLLRSAVPKGIDLSESDIRLLDLGGSSTGDISASNLVVRGELLLNHGFQADGAVNLDGSKIRGTLDARGAKILSGGQYAFSLVTANVDGDVLFQDAQTNNMIRLSLSSVGGNLSFIRAGFDGRATGLEAINTQVRGVLAWVNIKPKHPNITLDLTFARVGALADDADSWPTWILMNEFAYDKFDEPENIPKDLESRLAWLQKQSPFRPQPYLQLSKVFRGMGLDDLATAVLIVKDTRQREEDARRTSILLRALQLCWSWFLRSTMGYGYAPIRAFGWTVAIVTLGWIVFVRGYRAGFIVPSEKDACASFTATKDVPAYYPPFSGFIYSLETFLPFVELHQAKYWLPVRKPVPLARLLPWYLRLHILSGWVLSTLLVAGLTGLLHKD
jgi:hypothetical protein